MPFPLTREQEKALARAGTWQGPMAESLMRKQFQEEVGTGLGLDAIANIRRRESEEDEMIAPARSDLSMLGKKIGLAQETGDPEELARMEKSLSPRGSLTPHISQLQEKATPTPFSQLREEEITAKGLGELPEVQGFLKGRAETSKLEAATQKQSALREGFNQMVSGLPEDRKENIAIKMAQVFIDAGFAEEAAKLGTGQIGDIGKEDVVQSGKVGMEGLKHRGAITLQEEKQEDAMELAKFKRETDLQLKSLTDKIQSAKPMSNASASALADTGFAIGHFGVLNEILASNNANVFNTVRFLGNFTNPKLKNTILQLKELHGRDKSGAAISKKEWDNFEKQILNRAFLLTPEGRAEAKRSVEGFIGRYYNKGKSLVGDGDWYDAYVQTSSQGVKRVTGEEQAQQSTAEPTRDFGKEYDF